MRRHLRLLSIAASSALVISGCMSCPDLSAPDTAAYQIGQAYVAESDTAFASDRPDLVGGLIVEEGDSLRILYRRSSGELVEVTYLRTATSDTAP